MPSKSKHPNQTPFPRRTQISDSHCGPAVVQMLLQHCGFETTQEDIVKAAGIEETLEEHGSRIDQLSKAVEILAPTQQLFYKEKASLDDLDHLINHLHNPVAVEWQGLFETDVIDDDDLQDEEADYGHYSIITTMDNAKRELIIIDPYKDFIDQDRIFSYDRFLKRWWDTNEIADDKANSFLVIDRQLLFFINSKFDPLPILDLKPGSHYLPKSSTTQRISK